MKANRLIQICGLFFFLLGGTHFLWAQVAEQDSLALVALYNSTDGPNWTNHDNWLSGPVPIWYGVKVFRGRVTELALRSNNLAGTIPAEIGDLIALEKLDLFGNQLVGSIPSEIGNLRDLTSLNLTDNHLEGLIPEQIANLTNLNSLSLGKNQLTGSIPAAIGNLTNLDYLYLSSNALSGPIPDELGNLTKLQKLYLNINELSETIPASLWNLTELRTLYLYQNQLTGEIPPEIGNLTKLTDLSLYDNQLTGSIPANIGRLTELKYLILEGNHFSGELPVKLFNLAKLVYLELQNNRFTGPIPVEFERLTELENLNLSNNAFTDTVKIDFSKLKNLQWLYLYSNELVGPLPATLDSLPKLRFLLIHKNHFMDLPDLSQDTSLTYLRIQNNRFTFEDIEPNVWVPTFSYWPQDSVGEEQDTTIAAGDPLEFSVSVGGTANQYQWVKDGADIPGATAATYTIAAAGAADVGSYVCRVTNTIATALTLYSRPVHVAVSGLPNYMEQDSLALVALYDSTDGSNWTHNDNWLAGPVSTWYGVTVSGNRVTRLDLQQNNLVGTIPAEIGDLTKLTFLSFRSNQVTGSIPAEIGNMRSLSWFDLHHNQLNGEIPPQIGNLTNLTRFDLSYNQLSGEIPAEIGNLTNLTLLSLSSNQLSGEIPTEIGNLKGLLDLYLHHNQLSGEIPDEIGNLTNLTLIYFHNNQFSGKIPTEIGNLSQLQYLYLNNNQFSGALPIEFTRLTSLIKLYLSHNEFSDTIKVNFAKLKKLKWLYLHQNQFCGPVPVSIDSLPELEKLLLYDNRFIDLPDLSQDTSLTQLYIANNRFTFEDIEPNVWVETFTYSPQDSVGEAQDTTIAAGEPLGLSVSVGGTANQYQWSKDGVDIQGADSSVYIIPAASEADSGTYICRITNTIATELTLYSRPMHVAVSGGTGVEGEVGGVPKQFALHQNYPNPFNPTTTIRYDLPKASQVEIAIYNLSGQKIRQLVNALQRAGAKEIIWDGLNSRGQKVSSGVYVCRMKTPSFFKSYKMILMK